VHHSVRFCCTECNLSASVCVYAWRRKEWNWPGQTQCLGYAVPWGIEYRNLALQVEGVSKIETLNYGHQSRRTQNRERLRWRGPATTENYRPDLSSERAPHICKPVIKNNFKKEKIWSRVPHGYLTPRQTGRLTVGRNITLTWFDFHFEEIILASSEAGDVVQAMNWRKWGNRNPWFTIARVSAVIRIWYLQNTYWASWYSGSSLELYLIGSILIPRPTCSLYGDGFIKSLLMKAESSFPLTIFCLEFDVLAALIVTSLIVWDVTSVVW
jgi:hypothetical protein